MDFEGPQDNLNSYVLVNHNEAQSKHNRENMLMIDAENLITVIAGPADPDIDSNIDSDLNSDFEEDTVDVSEARVLNFPDSSHSHHHQNDPESSSAISMDCIHGASVDEEFQLQHQSQSSVASVSTETTTTTTTTTTASGDDVALAEVLDKTTMTNTVTTSVIAATTNNIATSTTSVITMDSSTATDHSTNPQNEEESPLASSSSSPSMSSSNPSSTITINTNNSSISIEPEIVPPQLLPKASQTDQLSTSAVHTQTSDPSSTSKTTIVTSPPPAGAEAEAGGSQSPGQQRFTNDDEKIAALKKDMTLLQERINTQKAALEQYQKQINELVSKKSPPQSYATAASSDLATRPEPQNSIQDHPIQQQQQQPLNIHQDLCQVYSSALLHLIESEILPTCDAENAVSEHLHQVINNSFPSDESLLHCAKNVFTPWLDSLVAQHQLQQQQQATRLTIATSNFKVDDNVLFIADPSGVFYEAFNIRSPNYIVSSETLGNCELNPKKLSRFVGTIIAIQQVKVPNRNPFKLPANTPVFMCDVIPHK